MIGGNPAGRFAWHSPISGPPPYTSTRLMVPESDEAAFREFRPGTTRRLPFWRTGTSGAPLPWPCDCWEIGRMQRMPSSTRFSDSTRAARRLPVPLAAQHLVLPHPHQHVHRRVAPRPADGFPGWPGVPAAETPDRVLAERERDRLLRAGSGDHSRRGADRHHVVLRRGRTYQEIGAIRGISENTVKTHLRRGRAQAQAGRSARSRGGSSVKTLTGRPRRNQAANRDAGGETWLPRGLPPPRSACHTWRGESWTRSTFSSIDRLDGTPRTGWS